MATHTNIIEDGFDRIQEAVESANEEFQSIQKRFSKQRSTFAKDARKRVKKFQTDIRKNDLVKRAEKFQKTVEKDVRKGVKNLETNIRKNQFVKRAEKFQKTVEKDVRKSDAFKNAQQFQKNASERFETTVDGVLGALQIASSNDIAKLDRKLGQINRKLKELEKARAIQPAKSL